MRSSFPVCRGVIQLELDTVSLHLFHLLSDKSKRHTPGSFFVSRLTRYSGSGNFWGSLILGGYDAARYMKPSTTDSQLTFPLTQDPARDLVVGISSIKYSSTTELLDSKNITFAVIDSSTPFFRLPEAVCKAFEDAFGLTWNDQTELYTLNASQHLALSKLGPEVTFTLSPTLPPAAANKAVSITLPYAALDLTATAANGTETLYFPLKRAVNESQVSLGRAFLQEAYLIADYERNEFSVWPVDWSWTSAKSNVVPIASVTKVNRDGEKPSEPTRARAHIGKGVIAGIAVGSSAGVIVLTLLFFLYRRRRSQKHHCTQELPAAFDHELHSEHRFESPGDGKFELNGIARPLEADVKDISYEMDAGQCGGENVPEIRVTCATAEPTLEVHGKREYGVDEKGSRMPVEATKDLGCEEQCEKDLEKQGAMSFNDFMKRALVAHR